MKYKGLCEDIPDRSKNYKPKEAKPSDCSNSTSKLIELLDAASGFDSHFLVAFFQKVLRKLIIVSII